MVLTIIVENILIMDGWNPFSNLGEVIDIWILNIWYLNTWYFRNSLIYRLLSDLPFQAMTKKNAFRLVSS